jgi:hypothetical protein
MAAMVVIMIGRKRSMQASWMAVERNGVGDQQALVIDGKWGRALL